MQYRTPIITIALLTALCVSPYVLAQPGSDRDTPSAHTPEQRAQFVEHMIQRRLEEIETEQARLEQIQARLDAGESIDDIRADTDLSFLRPANRDKPRPPAPRGERRRGTPAEPSTPATDLAHDEMLSMLRDIDPTGARDLERVRQHRPERFKTEMDKRRAQFAELRTLREENPELYGLKTLMMKSEREMFQTIRQHMRGGGEPDEDLRAELRPLVEQQLKTQAAIRSLQIDRMERKLEDARASIESESEDLNASIDERLNEVMQRVTDFRERRFKNRGARGQRGEMRERIDR